MNYRKKFDLSVYFVADPSVCGGRDIADVIIEAVAGGVTMVQLRNKIDSLDSVENQALRIQSILSDSGVPFILNDHVALAAKIGADGVHIGQGDMSVAEARLILGDEKILGLTAFTSDHIQAIDPKLVDYIGVGPFYATRTKPDKPVLGALQFTKLVSESLIPVVGIGGITPQNTESVIKAGADGVAMIRAISESANPKGAAKAFSDSVEAARRQKQED